ncbi:MAG: flippase-like domain-containing protein [Bacteroidetes bacterium]|nr:MAG: flippase-like domain-containing protein [Bacteroidota bacterium]
MEDITVKVGSKKNNYLQLLLKITITVVCIWYISKKIDFRQLSETLFHAKWLLLMYGIIFYLISKVFAAIRLNIYFRNINIHLPQIVNLKLYWLGLFYNLFLPGSISGDAYKVIRLTKQFGIPYKKTTSAVLLDRVTGLLGLAFVLAFYGALVLDNRFYILGLIVAAILATLASYFIIKKWFRDFLPGFWPTFLWGLVVQLFANASAYAIILSLGLDHDLSKYIFIFLVASIAAVLPLTLGGLGAREIVFLELSKYFGLNEHTSVLIGFLVYITVVISSAGGVFYIFVDPLRTVKTNEIKTA